MIAPIPGEPPQTVTPARPARRSRFVTVVAWLGIISGVLGSVMGLAFVAGSPGMTSLVLLASSAASLATSIGLRERREWARRGLIAVLGYTIVMGFYGALTARMPGTLTDQLPPDQLAELAATMRSTMLTGALVMGALNGLIIAKLCTRRVREEFDAAADR